MRKALRWCYSPTSYRIYRYWTTIPNKKKLYKTKAAALKAALKELDSEIEEAEYQADILFNKAEVLQMEVKKRLLKSLYREVGE